MTELIATIIGWFAAAAIFRVTWAYDPPMAVSLFATSFLLQLGVRRQ